MSDASTISLRSPSSGRPRRSDRARRFSAPSTDPEFLDRGQRAYLGKGLWSRRLTDPALTVDEVPQVDAVLLSHLHGDHFDRVARKELLLGELPVVTTPQAARPAKLLGLHLPEGLPRERQVELAHG